ncbi:MAG TPA: hypothetical protein VIJ94_20310 [Caulobacteraceae bacterium]
MSWLKSGLRELIGLFIDDGSFALAIVVWVVLVGLLASQVTAARPWSGLLLFLGLAAILAESAVRRARK